MTNAAVIGGGVFGATVAVELAQNGVNVDLYECGPDILHGASSVSQGRLHEGFHYPRSVHTAEVARDAADEFISRFPNAIVRDNDHFYCVALNGSMTSAVDYINFCDKLKLTCDIARTSHVRDKSVDVCIKVQECLIDIHKLRKMLHIELSRHNVNMFLNTYAQQCNLDMYDYQIWTTYGQPWHTALQYEVCETAIISLSEHYQNHSYVIMDGPFISLDPIPGTNNHMLYDVYNSVHHTNIGDVPEIPAHLSSLVNQGVVHTPHTRVKLMENKAQYFLMDFNIIQYHGSMFTVRAVLPNVDNTDERSTHVHADGTTISVLSGKIGTAPRTAQQIAKLVTG